MRPRIALGKFLIRLGRFISSLAIMVMRPDDLVEFGRRNYAKAEEVKFWGSDEIIAKGLSPLEKEILEKLHLTGGKVLVLGLGGGREAIPLAKLGFAVTGVDFIPEMVAMAQKNAIRHGVALDAQVGDLAHLAPPPAAFDLIWLSDRMYSCIPTRSRRIEMLKKMHAALRPGGFFACMFYWYPRLRFSPKVDWLRKVLAYLTLGNLWYEPGDVLHGDREFIHTFRDESELSAEFAEGGFELFHPYIIRAMEHRGLALLRKAQ